jgi:2-aminoadipate transaminase
MNEAAIHFSERSVRCAEQPINYFMQQAIENPQLISLAAGLVDEPSLPAAAVAEALQGVLGRPESARAALQYGTAQGLAPLRARLLERLARADLTTPAALGLTPDDVVVTTGSQQLLYLIGELLLDPGDIVITEAPSYFVYQGTLESLGVQTIAVPMDQQGLNTHVLEDVLRDLERSGALERLRFIYTCDYFQNPTGLTLSLPRRQHLMDLVRRYSGKQRLFVVEDAAYRELRYDGPDLPSIKSFDGDNRHVILAMTFSKPCAPGLKTGYGFVPRELVAPLLRLKGNHDFGSNNLTQHLVQRLLDTGVYDRHVSGLCEVYRRKRDALLAALAEQFAAWPEVRWTWPDGGLYVWLCFPPGVSTGPDSPLMQAALREGVLYVPGRFCYQGDNRCDREARLSFGIVPLERIGEAVGRLARAAGPELVRAAKAQTALTTELSQA